MKNYRLAIIWAIFFTTGALGSAILIALSHVEWEDLDFQDRFLLIVAISINFGNTMMAYISKAAKAEAGGDPLALMQDQSAAPPPKPALQPAPEAPH